MLATDAANRSADGGPSAMRSEPDGQTPPARQTRLERWLGWGAVLVAAVAVVRLLNLARLHAVNVLFWDHWGYYSRAWDPSASLWDLFALQHGPHRGGIGYVLCRLWLPWTRADMRVDAFVLVSIVTLCSLVALALRRRLAGGLRWYDLGLVLLFVPPALAGAVAETPNPAHGALPLLLILLSALTWTITSQVRRYLCILPLNFLAIFTGFGLFWGLVTPVLLGHDLYRSIRARDRRSAMVAAVAVLLAIASMSSFLIHYRWDAGGIPGPFTPGPGRYATFVCLAYARLVGVVGTGAIPVAFGAMLAGISGVTVAYRGIRSLRTADPNPQAALVIPASLLAYTGLFAVTMASGRASHILEAAQVPRYIPLLLPGALGLYLCALQLRWAKVRMAMLAGFVVAGAWAGLHLDSRDASTMAHFSEGKRRWVAAYLQTRDPAAADRIAGFEVSPNKKRLPERLQLLEQHQLSFFAPWSPHPTTQQGGPDASRQYPQ